MAYPNSGIINAGAAPAPRLNTQPIRQPMPVTPAPVADQRLNSQPVRQPMPVVGPAPVGRVEAPGLPPVQERINGIQPAPVIAPAPAPVRAEGGLPVARDPRNVYAPRARAVAARPRFSYGSWNQRPRAQSNIGVNPNVAPPVAQAPVAPTAINPVTQYPNPNALPQSAANPNAALAPDQRLANGIINSRIG